MTMKMKFISFLTLSAVLLSFGASANENSALATYNGGTISDEEVMAIAKTSMMKPLAQIYSIKRAALENILADQILDKEAKSKSTTVEALVKDNVTSKVKDPTDSELKALFEMSKNSRALRGKKYEESQGYLKRLFAQQQSQDLMDTYLDKLFEKYNVAINLERPKSKVSVDDDPGLGNPKAPVVIVEFSDFQCPYCGKTRPTLDRIMKEYKDQVYYVFRDFPLSFHRQAKDAANAAHCAGEQNKYWEYNTALWDKRPQLSDLSTLDVIAKDLSLDEAKFKACVESKKYFQEIDKDQADGAAAGVSGTPAYFINGVFLSGAQPFEAFQEIIEEELAKSKKI